MYSLVFLNSSLFYGDKYALSLPPYGRALHCYLTRCMSLPAMCAQVPLRKQSDHWLGNPSTLAFLNGNDLNSSPLS